MHPELQRYLDGEIPKHALSPELGREAEEWDALLGDAPALRTQDAPPAPPWLEGRIMASLPERPQEAPVRRALRWLTEPRTVRLRPLSALAAAAAAVAIVALWPQRATVREPARPTASASSSPQAPAAQPAPADQGVVYVQFTIRAPGAHSVEVAGDFNDWQAASAVLRDPEGNGSWSGLVALPAGIHKYMFVIDGHRWVSDPNAHRYVDDGFGMKNSLIAIAPPARSS